MTMRRAGLVLALAFGILLLFPQLYERAILNEPGTLIAEGNAYRYILDQPDADDDAPPLIVALHGYGGDMHEMRAHTGLSNLTEQGFGVLYIQARRDDEGNRHWNAQMQLTRRNDLDALIETVQLMHTSFGFDPRRVYVVGDSNGGFMAYNFACHTSDLVRGFVVVSGTMSGADWGNCPASQTEPVLHLHGGLDDVVPLAGTAADLEGWGGAPAIEEVAARWAARLGAQNRLVDQPRVDMVRLRWMDASARVGAELQILAGIGHDWPFDPVQSQRYRDAIVGFVQRVEGADFSP